MPLAPPPKPPKAKAPPIEDTIPMTNGDIDDGLPKGPTKQTVEMNSLRWLFVAPPGFGKSEFFSCFPDSLMLCCEEGHKFIECPKIIIDSWEGAGTSEDTDGNMHMSWLTSMHLIERSDRYQFIIVDTLDALVKMCIDYHIKKANQQHLGDLGEYGKGYDIGQNTPIRRGLESIFKTGRGMGLITHQEIKTASFSKKPVAKKETTLPNGVWKFVYPQMDIIIHGEFGAVRPPNRHKDRIIRSEGSEDILAKNRGGVLPPAWISDPNLSNRGAEVLSFFTGTTEEKKKAIDAAFKHCCEFYEIE